MLSFRPMTKAALLLAGLLPLAAWPANLSILVKDASGTPVEDAVAWVVPKSGAAPRAQRGASVEQIDKAFVPLVSVVQAGGTVAFPNRDPIRHHVYSFSPAKVFEIKLYAGAATPPAIVFDKPGEVVLGCNIHDNMLGYIYVVDAPWYGKSAADGRIRLDNVPDGAYELRIWHYALAQPVEPRPVRVGAEPPALEVPVTLKPRGRRPATP